MKRTVAFKNENFWFPVRKTDADLHIIWHLFMHLFLIGDMGKFGGNARNLLRQLLDVMIRGKAEMSSQKNEESKSNETASNAASPTKNSLPIDLYSGPTMRDVYVYVIGPSNSIAHHLARIFEGKKDNYEYVMKKSR